MARIFITGSSDGLGLMAAQLLAERGHRIMLHARNEQRARDARAQVPTAEGVVIGDVETLAGMRAVADQANASGAFAAVIHNVAIGYREARRVETVDGIERLFATNVLAPYMLTALVTRPKRLVYLGSGLHHSGIATLDDPQWKARPWNGSQAYATSKLLDVVLAFGVARRWPEVRSNALEPGWVATKMGGAGAPGDLKLAHVTQAWLAESATGTAGYFFHERPRDVHPAARDPQLQDQLLAYCAELGGVTIDP